MAPTLAGVMFRKLNDDEIVAAHAIVAAATDWLNSRGIVQWPAVIPVESYRERQARGENFGLFDGGVLSAVVTLVPEAPERWATHPFATPFLWLSTLAVRRDRRGAGRRTVVAAEDYAFGAGHQAMYLDCVDRDGALPAFYSGLGWRQLERREVWPGWPMCLFERLPDPPAE